MDKINALENLRDIRDILFKMDCQYWLEAGTCLGAIREKDFIGHDNDTDIGVLKRDFFDWAKVLDFYHRALYYGFRIYHTFGDLEKGFEVALWRNGIKTDIFFFYEVGDKLWHGAWRNGGRNGDSDLIKLVFDTSVILPLKQIDFCGGKFNVPGETEKYLVARYGENWRVPTRNWDWATSPKCINNNFKI